MSDMGELEHFLNVRVTRTSSFLQLDQTVYASKVLEKFSAFLGPPTKIRKSPLPSDTPERIAREAPQLTEEEQAYIDNFPYRSLLGALLYLSMNTRPDITYAVGVLSRYGAHPTLTTCKLVVYLMQYMRGTVHMGIKFSGSCFDMHVFTDADWAGDILTRRSTTGYVVFAAGGPLSWQSKLQTTVSTSSMQSEYQAPYAGMQDIVWLRGVLTELRFRMCEPIPFFLDSQSAEDLALNPVFHKRSKRTAIKYHWVREHVDPDGEFQTARLIHVRTGDQTVDIFTKALTGLIFVTHRSRSLGTDSKTSAEVARDNMKLQRQR